MPHSSTPLVASSVFVAFAVLSLYLYLTSCDLSSWLLELSQHLTTRAYTHHTHNTYHHHVRCIEGGLNLSFSLFCRWLADLILAWLVALVIPSVRLGLLSSHSFTVVLRSSLGFPLLHTQGFFWLRIWVRLVRGSLYISFSLVSFGLLVCFL